MCNIMVFKPGVMPKQDQLFNCVYNNWHGYGLIISGKKRFEVIKRCPPEDGETDPSEIFDLLEDNKDYMRYLHVRHNTAGATNKQNTHPFEVYRSKDEEIYFMHNGTLYEFKSKITETTPTGGYTSKDDPNGASDSLNFVNEILKPLVSSMTDKNGKKANLLNPIFRRTVNRFWTTGNRGILIAKNQPYFNFGDWKTVKGQDDKEFVSANDEYFSDVKRGPEHTRRLVRREEEKRAREAALPSRSSVSSGAIEITSLKDVDFTKGLKNFKLSDDVRKILDDYEIWDRQYAVGLGNLTKDELTKIYSDKTSTIYLMEWIFNDYLSLYQEFCELEEKAKKQEKHIERLSTAANVG